MIDSTSSSFNRSKVFQVILSLNQAMAQRYEQHGSGSNGSPYDSPPRGRRLTIESLLNPSEEENSRSNPRYQTRVESSIHSNAAFHGYGHNLDIPNHGRRGSDWRQPYGTRRSPARTAGARREFRPTYSEEETYFIWYHRIDLGIDWKEITKLYNRQFPHRSRDGPGGIQCKYYRCCSDYNIPKVRNRDRSASSVEEYGMEARTGLFFPWMRR